jgi:hypothetical protein
LAQYEAENHHSCHSNSCSSVYNSADHHHPNQEIKKITGFIIMFYIKTSPLGILKIGLKLFP